ncbi:hypothetical protein L1887_30271 [Cichorium endivia]|nr:hypothetical protein L1887_30271 [Cichorium endivia]
MESVLIRLHNRNEETSPSPSHILTAILQRVTEKKLWLSGGFVRGFLLRVYVCSRRFSKNEEEKEWGTGEYDSPGDGVAGAGDRRQYLIEESHLNRTRASVPHVWEGRTVEGFYMSFVWA